MSAVETAAAIYRIINTEMVGAMRAVSVMRGVDPRGYTVVVGGGAGGAHAAKIAQELGVSKAICPTIAGGLCAFGMLAADVGHAYLTTRPMNTGAMDISAVNAIYAEMEAQAQEDLKAQGFAVEDIKTTRFADAKYPYQTHEIIVPIPSGPLGEDDIERLANSFHDAHERLYTYSLLDMPVDMNGWRVTATGRLPPLLLEEQALGPENPSAAKSGMRPLYFPDHDGFTDTKIYAGQALEPGMTVRGPVVVELPTTTIVVFPGHTLKVSTYGDFYIEIPQ